MKKLVYSLVLLLAALLVINTAQATEMPVVEGTVIGKYIGELDPYVGDYCIIYIETDDNKLFALTGDEGPSGEICEDADENNDDIQFGTRVAATTSFQEFVYDRDLIGSTRDAMRWDLGVERSHEIFVLKYHGRLNPVLDPNAINGVELAYRGESDEILNAIEFALPKFCKDVECEQPVRTRLAQRKSVQAREAVFQAVMKDIRKGHYIRGYGVDSWDVHETNISSGLELLSEGFEDGDGASAWSEEDLNKLRRQLYDRGSQNLFIARGGVTLEYRGGTGVEEYVIIYDAKEKKAFYISHFVYAE